MSTTTTRCGKSRLLDLVEALCHRPILTANASPSAVYRCIGEDHTDPSTLLIDEADTIFGPRANDADEDLRGLLNAGHQRGRPAIRYDAGWTGSPPSPWPPSPASGTCPTPSKTEPSSSACAAGHPTRPSCRSGPAVMVQPSPSSRPKLHAWVRGHLDELESAAPELPVEDRAADTWEPLVAIADPAAGGPGRPMPEPPCSPWPPIDVDVDNMSLRVPLLIDIRTAFRDAERVLSDTLVARLREDLEARGTPSARTDSTRNRLPGCCVTSGSTPWRTGGTAPRPAGSNANSSRTPGAGTAPSEVPGALPSQPSQRHTSVKM